MVIKNLKQRLKDLDSDKAKHENLLFINPFAVDPGEIDFRFQVLIDLQNSAALKARYEKLSFGDCHRAGSDGLLKGRTSYNLSRVTVIWCEFHLSLLNDVSVRTSFFCNEIRKVEIPN